ncbi:hypothetical protein [Pseudomonas asplenii]|uniref:hypothetical protein n=1 Tax=Pseudomonas asplenii TaxID=53407 RepID=UPI0003652527|nr:hypothetical protein [Pseudomonas fuscovaginae]
MDAKASLHELLAAFTSDLKNTEKHLKQSITDVGSEFRGSLNNIHKALKEQGKEVQSRLERQGEQIAAIHTFIGEQFNELRWSRETAAGDPCGATERKVPDLPDVGPVDQLEEIIDERSVRLEAAIRGLNSKNRLIQWQLGIVAFSVALPYVHLAFERFLALCQL